MVKNQKGGNKSKKMGRKFLSAPVDKKLRLASEEGEIYAVVTKLLGQGMFYANDPDGKERLCVMRNKFKGRGKRDNVVALGGWVLIGEREFESCAKPKHDLLEVYNESEKSKLKKSGNPIFTKLKSDYDNVMIGGEDGVDFDDNIDKYEELEDLIAEEDEKTSNGSKSDNEYSSYKDAPAITIDGEEIDIDDI